MQSIWRAFVAGGFLLLTLGADLALAQKAGGTLRVYFFDSPGSMSIHEESTIAAEGPMMAVFNNLVMYKQDVRQNSLQSIVPDLATSWTWNNDHTRLTFKLREGVKWHDGKPFTSKDVQCTWNLLLGKAPEKLRINPRRAWYGNLEDLQAEAAATGLHLAARLRLLAGLPLPRGAEGHAHQADRHRPVQVRRVQAERVDQGGA
jgi:peptide/nickel transport system substrate-binding protein